MPIDTSKLARIVKVVWGSQRQAAAALGVHETTVSYWLNGAREPSIENIALLADLGINLEYLSGAADWPFSSTDAGKALESQMVEAYGSMETLIAVLRSDQWTHRRWRTSTDQHANLLRSGVVRERQVQFSPEIDKITFDQKAQSDVVIPMFESSIPAGLTVPIYEDLATSFNVTSYYANTFTMRVRGDSMIDAGIQDGDRVVIKRGHRFRNGDVIAALVDGEVTLKGVWKKDGAVYLVPANPKYPVMEIPEESEFQCLGVCIDTFRPPLKVAWRDR